MSTSLQLIATVLTELHENISINKKNEIQVQIEPIGTQYHQRKNYFYIWLNFQGFILKLFSNWGLKPMIDLLF